MKHEATKAIRRLVRRAQEDPALDPKSYRRAAAQRLQTARFLLNHSIYHLDVIYLAGYAAECALKALILERSPKSKWAAVCEEIGAGSTAHIMDFLAGVLNRKRCPVPDEVAESLKVIRLEWTTSLRYVAALIPRAEAEDFVRHIELIWEWAERSK